jgi:putative protease
MDVQSSAPPQKKPELLAPAGNMEKLRTAVRFGADAVYLAGSQFGLRAGADNFSTSEMAEGIAHAHAHGRKAYLALNILAHNRDIDNLPAYLDEVLQTNPDAVIAADPGVMALVREANPDMPIHLSTQANATNRASAMFWHRAGVRRIVLARELALEEILEIRRFCPDTLELEMFVHGAMCMSYSGRCMLSHYLTGRDANRGDCAQPCRWQYGVVEEKRPGEFFPVVEDERGTYLFNSRDLCLLRRIPDLMRIGLSSFKIEGRMKSAFYAATVVKAYREAIDSAWSGIWRESDVVRWEREVASVSNRGFTEGFLDGVPGSDAQKTAAGGYSRWADFVALVPEDAREPMAIPGGWRMELQQRNRFYLSDGLECLPASGPAFPLRLMALYDSDMNPVDAAPHPQMKLYADAPVKFPPGSLLRRPASDTSPA